ncbi:uncharacterized protein LOC116018891 isoform X2 [Ipomoea triloba]|uniref:uncharacterized protein LOC116018891 isoform X1 n=1 Tax=Ipomoea triloba TaxID=35885 RepID=UPI00125E73B0|nr:uncharacterized protein LOC116018891 isoform X1 [Ipomoea triloba]XP_031114777.1 uncharacterized protein LOC116018891 isoform X2 [Ipomoea triloba]
MAATAISSMLVPPTPLNSPLIPFKSRTPSLHFRNDKLFIREISPSRGRVTAKPPSCSASGATAVEESIGIDALQRFIDLNTGNWTGSFHQFDSHGNLLHSISTKLAVGSYGEDELISLIQTLYIRQPQSTTSFSGEDYETEWYEYKIKETNLFTVDKYQQIGFFPKEKAFALRYQTAGMLETVLRQGVLGEDDVEEESPRNLKIPSKRPSIVCENCLYSLEKDMRVRAFHIMDPKGIPEMLLVFLEERGGGDLTPPTFDKSKDEVNRISPHLGKWNGYSITKRTGVYGATVEQADTIALFEMNKDGQLIQDITSTSSRNNVTTNLRWTGTISGNLVSFNDGAFQFILLPGGMYMGCPTDLAKSVHESKSFHLEFCWLESPDKRQRLVRTFDMEGLAVSSTYFFETKL